MNLFKKILAVSLLLLPLGVKASENSMWMRYPRISPDGKNIAFCYQGDIYIVSSQGGEARQLTTHSSYEFNPIWSPDSKKIAFASDRNGNFDIYEISALGGAPKRMSYWSGKEIPLCYTADGESIYMLADIMVDEKFSQSPEAGCSQVYLLKMSGTARPQLVTSIHMEDLNLAPDGATALYHDKKGYEDPWRKHHTSSITRNVWKYNFADGSHQQLTTFAGEDRNPVFNPQEPDTYYYLSEESGSFNVHRADVKGGKSQQITRHTTHPVRFLSIDNQGTLCYAFNGKIYTKTGNAEAKALEILIRNDNILDETILQAVKGGFNEMAVSPSGKELAFVYRGDIFVTSAEYETTVRITNTPEQERSVSFSHDGKSLVYASERNGIWNIYTTTLKDKDADQFCYARDWEEKQITTSTDKPCFQPAFSPDDKEIAYLYNRQELQVINLSSKKTRVILDGKYNYSYSDGDQWYQWSPDGKWFAVNYFEAEGWLNTDLALVSADGKQEIHNLTESGYSNFGKGFTLGGKALLMYTDKNGYRSHGSWGADVDIYIQFLEEEAFDQFLRSKEEVALFEKAKKESKEAEKKAKKEEKDSAKVAEGKKLPEFNYEIDKVNDRTIRLTKMSGNYGDCYLSKDGQKFYYFVAFDKGYDLWVADLKENTHKMVAKLGVYSHALVPNADESKLFIIAGGQMSEINLASGQMTPVKVNGEFNYRPAQERTYMFNHAWKQVEDKFYMENIHGIDWKMYRDNYTRFLSSINNGYDFAELMSELLGELNGSHTGCRYYPYASNGDRTAVLGCFYDNTYEGDGLKIASILKGNTIFKADSKVEPGVIIKEVDGQKILKGEDYFRFFNKKAGKPVLLTLEKGGKTWQERVEPRSIGWEAELLYKRWVESREELVAKLSDGKIGYIHVRGMNSPSFRNTYSKLLGKYRNCESVIIDTRFNGGGWLHDDLATLLNGKKYAEMAPRGQVIASEPVNKWQKPSVVLVSEGNYSDAHGFPFSYKALKIGKLIGMPVPGTMTAVWWEQMINPSFVFGIPQMGFRGMDGKFAENQELQPDIKVNNTPDSMEDGLDLQVEAAVKELLK